MELKDFVNLLVKKWQIVLVSTILVPLVTTAVLLVLPHKYRATINVYVKRLVAQDSEEYYTYDGYYSTQAAVNYTDTVSGFFQSLVMVKDTAESLKDVDFANIVDSSEFPNPGDTEDLEDFADRVSVEDIAPQVINVQFIDKNESVASIWLSHLGDTVKDAVDKLNETGDSRFQIDIINEVPIVKEVKPNLLIVGAAAVFSGLLLGSIIVFAVDYFKNEK